MRQKIASALSNGFLYLIILTEPALWTWIMLTGHLRKNYANINAVIAIFILALAIFILLDTILYRQENIRTLLKVLKSGRLLQIGFSLALATSFIFSAIISRHWTPEFDMENVYLKFWHWHHWIDGLILGYAIFRAIVPRASPERLTSHYRSVSRISLIVFAFFAFIAATGFLFGFTANSNISLKSGLYSIISLGISISFKNSPQAHHKRNMTIMVLLFAMALGIFFDGLYGLLSSDFLDGLKFIK